MTMQYKGYIMEKSKEEIDAVINLIVAYTAFIIDLKENSFHRDGKNGYGCFKPELREKIINNLKKTISEWKSAKPKQ